jgi:hypothetical protein
MKWLPLAITLGLIGLIGIQKGMAEDYTYLLEPATMQVGQTLNEYLVVKDKCLTSKSCTDSEKVKYVTAVTGQKGKLEIPINAGSNLEVSFSIDTHCGANLTIAIYSSDNSLLSLDTGLGAGDGCNNTRVFYSNGFSHLNWKVGVNDLRLIVENGILKISANNTLAEDVKLPLSGTITRIVVSKIDGGQEGILEIKARGIQKNSSDSSSTTPTPSTSNCTANYVPSTGRLIVPCVAIPITIPFSGTQTLNYRIEMQQRPSTFAFDLDLNSVKQQ